MAACCLYVLVNSSMPGGEPLRRYAASIHGVSINLISNINTLLSSFNAMAPAVRNQCKS